MVTFLQVATVKISLAKSSPLLANAGYPLMKVKT